MLMLQVLQFSSTAWYSTPKNVLDGLRRDEDHPILKQSWLPFRRQSLPDLVWLALKDGHGGEEKANQAGRRYELISRYLYRCVQVRHSVMLSECPESAMYPRDSGQEPVVQVDSLERAEPRHLKCQGCIRISSSECFSFEVERDIRG